MAIKTTDRSARGRAAKAKGSRRERQARDILRAAGYFVIKAGASLGEWDLVAFNSQGLRLIHVKSNRWPGSVEMEQMREFKAPDYATKEVWRFNDGHREPTIKELEE